MDLHYEPARPDELLDIMKIENAGFSPAEAATTDAMQERISAYKNASAPTRIRLLLPKMMPAKFWVTLSGRHLTTVI